VARACLAAAANASCCLPAPGHVPLTPPPRPLPPLVQLWASLVALLRDGRSAAWPHKEGAAWLPEASEWLEVMQVGACLPPPCAWPGSTCTAHCLQGMLSPLLPYPPPGTRSAEQVGGVRGTGLPGAKRPLKNLKKPFTKAPRGWAAGCAASTCPLGVQGCQQDVFLPELIAPLLLWPSMLALLRDRGAAPS
jgi:hypothetical protein